MKILKLMAASSVMAMTAAHAHALDIAVSGSDFIVPLANELCLGDNGVDPIGGTVRFQVTLTNQPGNFPQDTLVTVNLPAGVTFDAGVVGESLTSSQTTLASVQSGGAEGDSTVQFVLSEANSSATQLNFELPVEVSECPDGSGIDVIVLDTQNNLFVEGDAVVNTNEAGADANPAMMIMADRDILAPCEDAITTVIRADDPEKEIALPDYDAISTPLLGAVEVTLNPVALDGAGTLVAITDIDDIDHTMTVENTDGLLGAQISELLNPPVPTPFGTDDTATVTTGFGPANITTYNAYVFADSSDDQIQNQSVMLETSVNFTDASGLEQKESTTGALDPLNRQGAVFGTFDWVGAASGNGTATVLRVTGLPTDEATPYTVELTNTPNGEYDGSYSGTIAAGNDGELALTSFNLFGVDDPVPFVRGDAQICFETISDNVDVDRLLARNGVVSAFNDGSNLQDFQSDGLTPLFDDDNGRLIRRVP